MEILKTGNLQTLTKKPFVVILKQDHIELLEEGNVFTTQGRRYFSYPFLLEEVNYDRGQYIMHLHTYDGVPTQVLECILAETEAVQKKIKEAIKER